LSFRLPFGEPPILLVITAVITLTEGEIFIGAGARNTLLARWMWRRRISRRSAQN
jgi:D-serine deaminase-like pyridoxal phosphate-dependent protein